MLDDELHVLIRKAFNRTNRAMTRFTADLGLKPGQPKVLEYLSEHDGSLARDICRGCVIDKSTMAVLLPRMEEQGLIRRVASAEDARAAHVFLTERGRELAQAIRAGAQIIDGRAFADIPEADRAATVRTLRRIAKLDDAALCIAAPAVGVTDPIGGTDTPDASDPSSAPDIASTVPS